MVAPRNTRQDYPAQEARGAVIILRKPWQRVVFFGGLVGCVLVALVAALMR
jgi:hypothetical protein